MKVCLDCHKNNIFDSVNFCPKCGNSNFYNSDKYCPKCNEAVCGHHEFCEACGYSLKVKEKFPSTHTPKTTFINRLLNLFGNN